MDLDGIVARCRHDIDILTATFDRLSKTDIATLVLTAHLDGQCDALEDEGLMASTPDERADYVRALRAVANKLHD
ncbi:MAG TPA: hypothetical protein VGH54_23945 [Mycobacterium sp.]|jgi:hypothetical protein|uniref:hypothetical protein n=1 Tax=Mycobacterium sp. TaxID=1785 RepID=UPI002F3F0933